jgi:hypothetical protein
VALVVEKSPEPVVLTSVPVSAAGARRSSAEANVGFALQAQNEHQPIVTVADQAASARQAAGATAVFEMAMRGKTANVGRKASLSGVLTSTRAMRSATHPATPQTGIAGSSCRSTIRSA